jgi:hypothetical protein
MDRPIPTPYARVNVSLYTPDDYGPKFAGLYPLGGYMLNLLINWQEGEWVDWNPKNVASIQKNVQETDYFNAILRFSKTFQFNRLQIMAFVDIENLFNYRRMSLQNFTGKGNDRNLYYASLHLPASEAYDNIPGDDRVGDYRKSGVEFQPIELINDFSLAGKTRPIYYQRSTGTYWQYVDNPNVPIYQRWSKVDQDRIDQILADKAYIDMPDYSSFSFFHPRQIYFGLRISFDFN